MESGLMPQNEAPAPSHTLPATPRDEVHKDEIFEPCLFFFYGTLMDPAVLMSVAMLDKLPELEEASIEGFEMKMWSGIYPKLVPQEAGRNRIKGKAWRAMIMEQCLRLQLYETSAYEVYDCWVNLGREELVKGLTF